MSELLRNLRGRLWMTRLQYSLLYNPLLAAVIAACSSTTNATPTPGSGPGGPSASSQDVSRCKSSCDKMKFFGCNSAEEQARCYADCDKASASQIEVFTGCAGVSICDPACRTKIEPA